MKIGIQTIKGQKHSLEVAPEDTILAVKQKIASELGLGDASEQKLIYLGKVLANEQTIADVKMKPNDMLVVMVSKIKKAAPAAGAGAAVSSPAAPAAAPTPAAAAAPAPAPAAAPAAAAVAPPAAAAAPVAAAAAPVVAAAGAGAPAAAASSLSSSAASNVVMGSAYEESVLTLMSMGFERQQVVDALRAAYNNADRAADYLFGPESVLRAALAQAGPGGAPGGGNAPRANQPASPAVARANSQQGQAPQQQAAPNAAPGAPSANELMAMAGQAGIDPATIQQLQGLLQSNPQLAPMLLQQVAQSSPEIMAQLGNNPQALQQLLAGLGAPGGGQGGQRQGGGGGGQRGRAIQITEAENQQINNLQALGFSRDVAVEAWLICDRQEALAANYLFEHGNALMEDEAQHGGDDGGDDHGEGGEDEEDEDGNIDGPFYE